MDNESKNKVTFFATFGKESTPSRCCCEVYQYGELVKKNISRLLDSPTGLTISMPSVCHTPKKLKSSESSITVNWEYEALGFPCHFVIERGKKGELGTWIPLKTPEKGQPKISIKVETEATLEIRVSAETFIGFREFGAILDTSSHVQEDEEFRFLLPTGLKWTT